MNIVNAKRSKAEEMIYKVMDSLDKTGSNTEYYKRLFTEMNDDQFLRFCKRDLPFRFQTRPFEIEPTMSDCKKALSVMKVPLMEKVALPFLYTNNNGEPIMSQEALVVYIHIKKMKQFITKKNAMSTGIDERDMKSGLLVSFDKNGKTSDREMESLAVRGLDKTMDELSSWRADAMDAKSIAYQTINLTGQVSESDIPIEAEDSLARNMLNCYLVGALINTNILNKDYILPRTMSGKERRVVREVE